jgi:hypothetical protein
VVVSVVFVLDLVDVAAAPVPGLTRDPFLLFVGVVADAVGVTSVEKVDPESSSG